MIVVTETSQLVFSRLNVSPPFVSIVDASLLVSGNLIVLQQAAITSQELNMS